MRRTLTTLTLACLGLAMTACETTQQTDAPVVEERYERHYTEETTTTNPPPRNPDGSLADTPRAGDRRPSGSKTVSEQYSEPEIIIE
ncbi:MAG: hypothetical protein AAGK09_09910 [Planctomycetota bacterium]